MMSNEQIASMFCNGLLLVVGMGFAALLLLYANQDKMLYICSPPGFPKEPRDNPPGYSSPGDWTRRGTRCLGGKSDPSSIPFEEHFVETPDKKHLHVWLLLQDNSASVPTLIYFHGNAANMGLRLKNAAEMFAISGVNVLMMDYRGYGSSDGTPSEAGLNMDAEAVLHFAHTHHRLQGSVLVAFGRSLGGAVSIELAHRFPHLIGAVVVENTFTSVGDMVDVLMPPVAIVKGLVLRIGWNSKDRIASLRQPILFISGDSDELVPPVHMKRLFDLATSSVRKEFFSVSGGTHNDTWERAGRMYYQKIFDFLAALRDSSDGNNNISGLHSSVNSNNMSEQHCSVPTTDRNVKIR